MKIEIKHWWTGGVLFEHDAEINTIKLTVEAAVKARARLDGARLDDGSKILKCERPIFQIGGLGSASRYFVAHLTDKGIRLRTGCFFGSIADFRAKLKITHKDNTHTVEYEAAITLIEAHFKLWPKVK